MGEGASRVECAVKRIGLEKEENSGVSFLYRDVGIFTSRMRASSSGWRGMASGRWSVTYRVRVMGQRYLLYVLDVD